MRKNSFIKVLIIAVASLLLIGFCVRICTAATPISSCTEISSPGEYVLTQDIIDSGASSCINITSSDVVFDCQGHAIDGLGTVDTYGVHVHNSATTLTNVTVKNLNVTDWYRGIYYNNATNGRITDNNANNNFWGIYLENSSNNMLSNNNASNNNQHGIYLYSSSNNMLSNNNANNNNNANGMLLLYSSNNTVSNNNANNNNWDGISFSGSIWNHFQSCNNMLSNNNANNNFRYGIYIEESIDNNLTNNTANSNSHGIFLDYSSNSTLTNNNANNNLNIGIFLHYSSNNTLTNNNVNNNDDGGIYLNYGDNNTLTNNNATNNGWAGIHIYDSSDNIIINNNANNNEKGIYLRYSSNNTLTNNNAANNNDGIYIEESIDNKIYNNYFNNTNNFGFGGTVYPNTWNTTKTPGANIVGGLYLGGNFWAEPDGTGFSQTCGDADSDGICDSIYILGSGNVDYLPLAVFVPPVSPEEMLQELLEFYDAKIDSVDLQGIGRGNSAENREKAIRNMISAASNAYENNRICGKEGACEILNSIYKKIDGEARPPDFIGGNSIEEFREKVLNLLNAIDCETCT